MMTPLYRFRKSKSCTTRMRGAALIAAACAALVALPAQAQQDDALVPDTVLSGATSQSVEGRQAIQNYLLSGNPRPQDIAARAVVAINQLQQSGGISDPSELMAAADRIAQVATPALCPPKVMKVFVDDSFSLPPSARGFDFGPPDARTMSGFERVAPGDNRLIGGQPRALQRPGNEALLSNGIVGVNKFVTPMENGTQRVLLFTDDIGNENTYLSPLGGKVVVNGRSVALGYKPVSEDAIQTFEEEGPKGLMNMYGTDAYESVVENRRLNLFNAARTEFNYTGVRTSMFLPGVLMVENFPERG